MAVEYRGKTALITGASSGIGEAFARELAGRGTNLVMVARSEERLRRLAGELSVQHGVEAHVVVADLSREGSAGEVWAEIGERGLSVDLLINNAGFGTYGPFAAQVPHRQHRQVMLNVVAAMDLARAALPAMVERGEGAVINVASISAFQPAPKMSVYGASKAFLLGFSEALWAEYRKRNVRVLALCPGPTRMRFWDRWGGRDPLLSGPTWLTGVTDTQAVVKTALRASDKNRCSVVPGRRNYSLSLAARLAPRGMTARVVDRVIGTFGK